MSRGDLDGKHLGVTLVELVDGVADGLEHDAGDAGTLEELRVQAWHRDATIGQHQRSIILTIIGVSWCLMMFLHELIVAALRDPVIRSEEGA